MDIDMSDLREISTLGYGTFGIVPWSNENSAGSKMPQGFWKHISLLKGILDFSDGKGGETKREWDGNRFLRMVGFWKHGFFRFLMV